MRLLGQRLKSSKQAHRAPMHTTTSNELASQATNSGELSNKSTPALSSELAFCSILNHKLRRHIWRYALGLRLRGGCCLVQLSELREAAAHYQPLNSSTKVFNQRDLSRTNDIFSILLVKK